jgi:hypothetical protein
MARTRPTPATVDLITSRQALDVLGLAHPASITRLVQSGRLTPAQRLPGRTGALLFNRADVEALAAERAAR